MISLPFLPKALPEALAADYLRANTFYPQFNAGLIIGAGSTALDMILRGELRHQDLPRLRARRSHVNQSEQSFIELHQAFKHIPCRMNDEVQDLPLSNPLDPHLVTRRRLKALITGWIPQFSRVAAAFAAEALPDLVPPLPP